jgi:plastocyanin
MTASVRVVLPGAAAPPPPPPPAPPPPAITRPPREAAPAGEGRGPVRHDVDIIEPNPANPNSWTFDPATLDIRTGDTVVWHNTGRMEHSITALDGSFDSGLLAPGATWSRTFDTPAFVDYRCTPHPWMTGVLRVAAMGGPPPAPSPGSRSAAATSAGGVLPPATVRQGSGPATHSVNIVEPSLSDAMSWAFNPRVVDARAGDAVVWRNTGTLEHSVTADTFDSGLLSAAKSFSKTFDAPGVYAYRCTPHPWMKGIVRVAGAEGGAIPEIPAGLDTADSGGGKAQSAAASIVEAARAVPGRILARDYGNAGQKLGISLLISAVIVGLTGLGAWRRPAQASHLRRTV